MTSSNPISSQCGGATKDREVPQRHKNWGPFWSGCDLALTCDCRSSLVAQQVSFWENETINHRARLQDRGGIAMSVSEAASGVGDGSVESTELAPGADGFHLEPRCRVCRNDQVRTKVNDLLAAGASFAMVLRALGDDNANLEKRDQVTIDSVRNHCGRHFPVQQVARATYREIVERRAREAEVDFVNGVATALTPMAFYECVMNDAFRRFADGDVDVSVDTGLRAAEKLQALIDA